MYRQRPTQDRARKWLHHGSLSAQWGQPGTPAPHTEIMRCVWGMTRGWGLEEQGCSFVLRVEQGKSCSGDKGQPLALPRPRPPSSSSRNFLFSFLQEDQLHSGLNLRSCELACQERRLLGSSSPFSALWHPCLTV